MTLVICSTALKEQKVLKVTYARGLYLLKFSLRVHISSVLVV